MNFPSRIEKIEHPVFNKHALEVFIKRDDLIHPIISGNKWRKLAGNIAHVQSKNLKGIISFGGAYSNHIHALAFSCFQQNIPAIGIIRGEPHYQNNFTLSWARYWGMKLVFVDRKTYRQRHQPNYLDGIRAQHPGYFVIPEGGTNEYALTGVGEVISELNNQEPFDTLMVPVGSGGTFSGLIRADRNHHKLLGIAVLKESDYLRKDIQQLVGDNDHHFTNWQLMGQFHRGGYAKFSSHDLERLKDFIHYTGIPFEPVYSGKMVLALLDLAGQGYFERNHRIMLIHTGGIQGLGGLAERNLIKATEWHLPSAPPVQ
jgi:1-aminocyclopropane-1-carboxylate deaminase/D-cysteine desulfhydrase-like pyridoxal-dependent ACC family enzyme